MTRSLRIALTHSPSVGRRRRLLGATALSFGLLAGLAFAAPGKLDPGFGSGGVVVTATAPDAGADFQNGLAMQRDGKVVVGGSSDMGAASGGHQWRIVTGERCRPAATKAEGTVIGPPPIRQQEPPLPTKPRRR
jgi:hypothetical protein